MTEGAVGCYPHLPLPLYSKEEQAEVACSLLLDAIGETDREGLADTPRRVGRMYFELTTGLRTPAPKITCFDKGKNDQLIAVLDIDFWSLCVPSKQHVNSVDGSKPASRVQVGDRLWTLSKGRTVETTVQEITSHKVRELVEIKTETGSFQVTPDHPFATEFGWEEAQYLEGNSIEWTSAHSLCRKRYEPKIGYSLGYSIGAVFSDGTVGDRCLSLVVNDEWFANKFSRNLFLAFGAETDVEPCSRPSGFTGKETLGFRVRIVSSYLADLFRMWAGGDANHMRQHFPRVVLNSQETMQGFLDGYIDGDGSRRTDRDASVIVSGNLEFLSELAQVIDSRFTPPIEGAGQLYVSDNWHRAGWFGKHGFHQEEHETTLVESRFVRVLSVERVVADGKKPFTVYSFKCDKEPTFLIQGHLSHNCEHHLVPFYGRAHIGYLPDKQIAGLSKFGRIVDWFAKRPQIQEEMTASIADFIVEKVAPVGVIVVVEASHLCAMMRGVQKPNQLMVTSAIRGNLPKDEFFKMLEMRGSKK